MNYIYLHGFLSGPDSGKGRFLSDKLQKQGITLLRPDLNGGDFKNMTISSQLNVAEKLLDSLPGDTILLGSSLGGFLAAMLAEKHKKVQKLVLMAPAFDFANRYLSRLPEKELEKWRETGTVSLFHYHFNRKRELSYAIIPDAEKYRNIQHRRQLPVQIFHGINDLSVPYTLSVEYLKTHPQSELILLNSDHGLLDKLETIWFHNKGFLEI
ncbi:MAG: YqiA/YcfP family alpha/beta fold hydrolase [Calditrichia bacterium]